jgi:hypothetical protein
MEFYLILTLTTSAIAALAALLYLKTRHIGFPVGVALLYYWSLYGAWSIVMAQMSGESGKQYEYLAQRMFPVELNDHYLMTLVLYAAFIGLVEMTLLCVVAERVPVDEPAVEQPIKMSHISIFVLVIVSLVGSFVILAEQLSSAADLNMSAYVATRGGLGDYHPLFTVHQVLNRVAVFSLAIGSSVYLAKNSGVFLAGSRSILVGLGYLLLLVGTFGYLSMLGNKNELFAALILGGVFYAANTARIQWHMAIPIGLLAVLSIGAINYLRSLPMLALLDTETWWEAMAEAPEIRSSGEAFAAHFSLYGILQNNAPLTYGASFVTLAKSLVPRFYSGERSLGTYVDYAESLGIYEGPTGEAYTVHHAAGWYLNFGLWGLLVGAVILGLVWGWCYNAHAKASKGECRWQNFLAIVAPVGLVSAIPLLVRAGPDAYKGLVIEAFIIPTFIIWCATTRGGVQSQPLRNN